MTAPAEFYRAPSAWNNIQIGGCVVRFDTKTPSGTYVAPRIHANDSHMCVGVKRVFIDWNEDQPRWLHFECESPDKIIAMQILPDETLTAMGVTCGPSGGGDFTKVPIYKDGVQIPANSLQLLNPYANLWCAWAWWAGDSSPVKQAVDDLAVRVQQLEAWQNEMSD